MREGRAPKLSGVDSDHRRRLTAAMVEVASEHGYAGATVARVVDRAGVSRATFYEHFADREACFLAAYEATIERVRTALRAMIGTATPQQWPEAILGILVSELSGDPAAARIALVEALAMRMPARATHEEMLVEVVELAADFLDRQPPRGALQVPATALLLGVGQVLAARAVAGATEGLERLRRDLQRWIDSYRLPDAVLPMRQRQWGEMGRFSRVVTPHREGPSLLPRGRSALAEEAAGKARQERVFDATARIVARDGYGAMTVARIAAAARIPRSAFYSHFDGKADAILATQTHGVREAMAVAAAEYAVAAPWPERVWTSLGAFLTHVAEKPDYARLDFIGAFAAGPPAIRHRQQNQMAFALFLEDGYRQSQDAERLPWVFSEAIGGAVFGLMRSLVVEGKTDRLLSLRPAVAYTVLAPFIGPQEAGERVQAWARGAR